jgi:hypothetical protein
LSWDDLASKNKVESKYLGNIPWFSPMELRTAQAVVAEATQLTSETTSSEEAEAEAEHYSSSGSSVNDAK